MNNSNDLIYAPPPWLREWIDDLDECDAAEETPDPPRNGHRPAEELVIALAEQRLEAEAKAQAIKAHIAELTERRYRWERKSERIRSAILREMRIANMKAVKDSRFSIYRRKTGGGILVVNEDELPLEFVRLKREPKKTDLQKHFKETGEVPPGCDIAPESETAVISTR